MRPKIAVRKGHGACRTGKKRFRDEKSANLAIHTFTPRDHQDPDHVPVRAYPCPFCKDWHITSQGEH